MGDIWAKNRRPHRIESPDDAASRVLWPLIRPLLLGHLRTRSVGSMLLADTFYGTHIHELRGGVKLLCFPLKGNFSVRKKDCTKPLP